MKTAASTTSPVNHHAGQLLVLRADKTVFSTVNTAGGGVNLHLNETQKFFAGATCCAPVYQRPACTDASVITAPAPEMNLLGRHLSIRQQLRWRLVVARLKMIKYYGTSGKTGMHRAHRHGITCMLLDQHYSTVAVIQPHASMVVTDYRLLTIARAGRSRPTKVGLHVCPASTLSVSGIDT